MSLQASCGKKQERTISANFVALLPQNNRGVVTSGDFSGLLRCRKVLARSKLFREVLCSIQKYVLALAYFSWRSRYLGSSPES